MRRGLLIGLAGFLVAAPLVYYLATPDAAKLRPNHDQIHYLRATALAERRAYPDAIKEYREALRLNPAYAEARYGLGVALLRSGDPVAAMWELRRVTRERPDYALAHFDLSRALHAAGRAGEAKDACREALRLDPRLARFVAEGGPTARAGGCWTEPELRVDQSRGGSPAAEVISPRGSRAPDPDPRRHQETP